MIGVEQYSTDESKVEDVGASVLGQMPLLSLPCPICVWYTSSRWRTRQVECVLALVRWTAPSRLVGMKRPLRGDMIISGSYPASKETPSIEYRSLLVNPPVPYSSQTQRQSFLLRQRSLPSQSFNMKLQITAMIAALCGAALAAPTDNPSKEKRTWSIPFPGEGLELVPEPSFPVLPFPFPDEPGEPGEPGEPTEDTGFPRVWPRPFVGGSCGESPIETLAEVQLPWGQTGPDQKDGEGIMMVEDGSESVIAGEDGQEDTGGLS
ncbi:hypothetical protein BJX70DRAFT_122478 [Aspergillus crustosus]